jgi:hypothetical protein
MSVTSDLSLNDASIRLALRQHLLTQNMGTKCVIDELHIHNGNSIADVVAVTDILHGFEIKGENDNVSRLSRQIEFYSVSFPRVSLVTTVNHLTWAQRNLPRYWGLIVATSVENGVTFRQQRRAKDNPQFSRETSLLMLWKDELIRLATEIGSEDYKARDSRARLIEKISPLLADEEAACLLSKTIYERFLTRTQAYA